MGFEETRDDAWGGREGPNFSKGFFLKTAVKCGAVQTGYWDGHESPYYGAHDHAESLEREGLVKKHDGPYRAKEWLSEETIWVPTDAGRKAVTS